MRSALARVYPRVRSSSAIGRLTALGIGLAAGMLALGGETLLEARADAWKQAKQASDNLTLALTRDIGRNITMFDLSLQGLRDAMAVRAIELASPEVRRIALFDRAATAEYLGAMAVVDAEGAVVIDSTAGDHLTVNVSDRDFFKQHRDRPDLGLFISRPFSSRLRDGDPSIAISRRITHPDGSFGGVVAGGLRLAYFSDLFAKLDLGSAGSVTLFRADGRIIMRRPYRPEDIDRDLGDTAAFRRYTKAESGSLTGTATLDGVDRLYTFRHIPNLPLVLSVAFATSDIYAAWWHRVFGIAPVLVLLCGGTVALCLLFRREISRRVEAEHGLRAAMEQVALVAATDSLTGIANRRAFDERLFSEWRRAARAQTEVALLLLDVDFFKRFNDTYGHLMGDAVLQSIAACIASEMRRPADIAARYGGEEFVALLPETDSFAARDVAERILSQVAALAIPHDGNPHCHVTLSIGVAVALPSGGASPESLVERADRALYQAKHRGRNRFDVATSPLQSPVAIVSDLLSGRGAYVTNDAIF